MACRCVLCVHRVPALRPEASATVDALLCFSGLFFFELWRRNI